MRVLVTWGSKHGGTAGIGRMIGETLSTRGIDVVAASVEEVARPEGFDAAIIGGALYANRWPGKLRRFVNRNTGRLRKMPVWFFSSGPLDDSADHADLPAPTAVGALAERVGAIGHVTFGGRLEPDVKGFPASAMAKTRSGDWRNRERIDAWAAQLAGALPDARPGTPVDHPARSVTRLLAHAFAGWALSAITIGGLLQLMRPAPALVTHAVVAPLVFVGLARNYFGARGAREPLTTAIAWTAMVMGLDLALLAIAAPGGLSLFGRVGAWLSFALVFLATWITGALMSTLPWPKLPEAPAGTADAG